MRRLLPLLFAACAVEPQGALLPQHAGLAADVRLLPTVPCKFDGLAQPTDANGVAVVELSAPAPIWMSIATPYDLPPQTAALWARQVIRAAQPLRDSGATLTSSVAPGEVRFISTPSGTDAASAVSALLAAVHQPLLDDYALGAALATRPDATAAVDPQTLRALHEQLATRSHLFVSAAAPELAEQVLRDTQDWAGGEPLDHSRLAQIHLHELLTVVMWADGGPTPSQLQHALPGATLKAQATASGLRLTSGAEPQAVRHALTTLADNIPHNSLLRASQRALSELARATSDAQRAQEWAAISWRSGAKSTGLTVCFEDTEVRRKTVNRLILSGEIHTQ